MNVIEKYERRANAVNSLVCVGLDSVIEQMPERFRAEKEPQFAFNRWIIEQTHSFVSAYKPNIAFYEARGDQGLRELKQTVDTLREQHPDILIICDAKRGDIDSTSVGYAKEIFDWLGCDAVTLNPYQGKTALQPFLKRADKGCIILCRTSNPGAGEFQDLLIDGKALWQVIAENVAREWNASGNCMLVVGANQPDELRQVRALVGEMTILVPGVGTQGGSVEQAVSVGKNAQSKGLIVNASRSVIFAADPAAAAQQLRDEINRWR